MIAEEKLGITEGKLPPLSCVNERRGYLFEKKRRATLFFNIKWSNYQNDVKT